MVGPVGTASALQAFGHVVSWKHPHLVVAEAKTNTTCYQDDRVVVKTYTSEPADNPDEDITRQPKRRRVETTRRQKPEGSHRNPVFLRADSGQLQPMPCDGINTDTVSPKCNLYAFSFECKDGPLVIVLDCTEECHIAAMVENVNLG